MELPRTAQLHSELPVVLPNGGRYRRRCHSWAENYLLNSERWNRVWIAFSL